MAKIPDSPKFTHLAVEQETKRKAVILGALRNERINDLIARLVDAEWKGAKQAGIVRDAMLEAQPVDS